MNQLGRDTLRRVLWEPRAAATQRRPTRFREREGWSEVYYSTMREVSQEAAEQKALEIAALPIEIIGVSDDLALAKQAALFKATTKMAYAGCFAAALAKQKNADLITGDPEFKAVEKEINIEWLN